MNHVDDDTIIIIMIMMMNGDRKLTKYTPFIHSFIQWINGLNNLSILISIIDGNDELILNDIQHSFAF